MKALIDLDRLRKIEEVVAVHAPEQESLAAYIADVIQETEGLQEDLSYLSKIRANHELAPAMTDAEIHEQLRIGAEAYDNGHYLDNGLQREGLLMRVLEQPIPKE